MDAETDAPCVQLERGSCLDNPLAVAAGRAPIVRVVWCHSYGDAAATPSRAAVAAGDRFVRVPRPIDPISALPADRFERKREQLANMVAVVSLAAPWLSMDSSAWPRGAETPPLIVDFCSGSGHLGLLLAACFPQCRVVIADWNVRSLEIARERLRKVPALARRVEVLRCDVHAAFSRAFDLGVALHACGDLTDRAISHCIAQRAAYVVCPCCVGKVGMARPPTCSAVDPMPFPRSAHFGRVLTVKQFGALAAAADFNAHSGSGASAGSAGRAGSADAAARDGVLRRRRRRCKWWMEVDRNARAEEAGWQTALYRMWPTTASPKNDMLVGVPAPATRAGGGGGRGAPLAAV